MGEGRWSGRSRHRADNRGRSHRQPHAVSWGAGETFIRGAIVVAAFESERLGEGLARLHGSGFGPSARVLDGRRGDLPGQLSRAGLPSDLGERLAAGRAGTTTSLLVVHAAARSEQVAELLGRSGALAVEIVPPAHTADSTPPLEVPIDAGLAEAGA